MDGKTLWILAIVGAALGFYEVGNALDKPRVHVTYTKTPQGVKVECVTVVSPQGKKPCTPGDENKYAREWVDDPQVAKATKKK